MYYSSNQSNNDYYSSYKQNMQEHRESTSIKKIIKLGLIILFFALLSVVTVYLVNYFSTETTDPLFSTNQKNISSIENPSLEESALNRVELEAEILPQSVQLQESTSQKIAQIQLNATDTFKEETNISPLTEAAITNKVSKMSQSVSINPKDIALIVEIIMAQMNNTTEPTLEEQLIQAQEQKMVKHNLKDINHYNKVVLKSNGSTKHPSKLMQLQNNLNNIITKEERKNDSSNYSKAIKKELSVRSNAMKIIVVQKGDTLSKIAQKAYGRKEDYRKIFIANPEVLKNPNEIYVGQKLRIPS